VGKVGLGSAHFILGGMDKALFIKYIKVNSREDFSKDVFFLSSTPWGNEIELIDN